MAVSTSPRKWHSKRQSKQRMVVKVRDLSHAKRGNGTVDLGGRSVRHLRIYASQRAQPRYICVFDFLFSSWRPMADVDVDVIRGLLALISCLVAWVKRLGDLGDAIVSDTRV